MVQPTHVPSPGHPFLISIRKTKADDSSVTNRSILDKIESLLRRFQEKGLLQIDGPNQFIEVEVGIKTFLIHDFIQFKYPSKSIKSGKPLKIRLARNGNSNYSSRDILTAINRSETHETNNLFYVTDKSQSDHFDGVYSGWFSK